MKRLAPFLPFLSLLLMAALLFRERTDAVAARAESARLRVTLDSLTVVGARVDTVYSRDTLRLWRTLTHYDSIRTTDTLTRNDTVFVPRVVADEAVASCRATVLTCEQRVSIRDSINATLTALNADTEARLTASERSARRSRLLWGAAGLGVGWLAGKLDVP